MADIVGFGDYAVIYPETVWGTRPVSPTRTPIPVTQCGLKFAAETRKHNLYTGVLPRKHSTNFRGMVAGPFNAPLFGWVKNAKPLARWLIEWGMPATNAVDLPSYGVQWHSGDADEASNQYNGCRVNDMTISGSEDSGFVDAALNLMGKSDEALATGDILAVPDDMEKLVDFSFKDVTFTLDSVATLCASFSIKQTNGLKPKYLNSATPSRLYRTSRIIEVNLVPLRLDDTWDIICRALGMSEHTLTVAMSGPHNGTGTGGTTNTTVSFAFPRLSYQNHAPTGGREDILTDGLNFEALKPDTVSDIMAVTWGET